MYVDRGDYSKALTDLTKAIQLNPNDSAAYRERADIYMERGEHNRAAADYSAEARIEKRTIRPRRQTVLAFLNESHTDFNITVGLCVGHDAIFNIISQAPVTTLIVKDRVLAHNPIGAVYCRYIRRTMLPEKESRKK